MRFECYHCDYTVLTKTVLKKHKLSTHVAQCILPPVEPEVLVYEVEGDGDVAVPCPGGPQVSGYSFTSASTSSMAAG